MNFDDINKERKRLNKSSDDVTPAGFVNNILTSRSDAILAAHYGGEFYTSDLSSSIIQVKHSRLLRRLGIEKKEIGEFSDIILGDFPNIRDFINKKERSFDEFLKLLDDSEKFRDWAKGVNPDSKLVKEYWESVSSVGWINKLPSKSLRYVIGAAIGAIDPATGLVTSAADSFLVDKIFRGWRPSHFVERDLKPFLEQ